MVANALSRKAESMGRLVYIPVCERPLALYVQALANWFMRLDVSDPSWDTVKHGDAKEVSIGDDGVLRMQGRIYISNVDGLHELILEDAHSSWYYIHPGAAKMHQDLRQHYWWRIMKKDILDYVAWCLNHHQVKYQHQRPSSLL
ncbi:uncharacterized protein [Nicotiana tomentosiformis]|uniref:uncharacterized protein n=1 Tax=Nicotiana tomentosiformis TaxID=4098 RepID=UPI00388C5ED5